MKAPKVLRKTRTGTPPPPPIQSKPGPGWGRAGRGGGQRSAAGGSDGGSDYPAGPGAAVDLGVFGQVVAAGELLLAQGARVGLDAGVGAPVAGQLVGPGEPGDTRTGKCEG